MKGDRLDPRTKIMIILCLSSSVLFVRSPGYMLGLGGISILVPFLLGVDLISLFKRLKPLWLIFLGIAIAQSFFSPDERVFFSLGSIKVLTLGGLELGMMTFFRMLVIVCSASIMTTTDSRETMQGLVQWKLPYTLAFMTAVGIRFFPIFLEEARDALMSLELRGVNIKRIPFGKKIKVYVYLLTPVLAGVLLRGEVLAVSAETRGFGAYKERTSYLQLRFGIGDWVLLILAPLFAIIYTAFAL